MRMREKETSGENTWIVNLFELVLGELAPLRIFTSEKPPCLTKPAEILRVPL